MINKIKKLYLAIISGLHQNKNLIRENHKLSNELIWANVFHDSIRGRKYLEDLSISPGRWAGNYSLMYILYRILIDSKPNRILEFGLGESSKIISKIIENETFCSEHIIIEHDRAWIDFFKTRHFLEKNSCIQHRNLSKIPLGNKYYNSYEKIQFYSQKKMDVYLVDGVSSDTLSRYYILEVMKSMDKDDHFVVIVDDYERDGEKETCLALMDMLKRNNVEFNTTIYSGIKSQFILATNKFQYALSL